EKKSVVLVEQFEFGHNRGSSHGESRITRYSYDHPNYVRMAKRAYPLWAEIMQESGEPLFLKTGGIDLDEENGKRIEACIESLTSENVDFEVIDSKEIGKRYPQFRIPAHTKGLYQADTGILNAGLCVKTLQKLARENGAILKENTKVLQIDHGADNVTLNTSQGKIKARKLILCAGGWMGPLLESEGIKLPLYVTQEQYAFFKPLKPEAFQPDKFPVFIHYGGTGSGGIGWYGFPIYGQDGVKSSVHRTGKQFTADNRDFVVNAENIEELKKRMASLLPDAAGEIIDMKTCLYTNSEDTHFVIDHLPGRANTVFFTGCSGHAFKFGAVIAEMLIAILENKNTCAPLDLFKYNRFSVPVN
ncbi:MAG: N-methyl-L-tryptophan oxidase, partial [Candidatus Obscuribacterales bacterium]|nr:N-methyl-L-tryptophan oxidase [Candidatus Obscuribacterales bacterium]